MDDKILSLKPVIDEDSKILILGSIPGKQSLEKREYYGNKRNAFWKIIFSLYQTDEIEDYKRKIEFLKEKNIGLWDVIKTCNREGSLDSNIKNEEVNDFEELLKDYPNIEMILFNGAKAYEVFKKRVGFDISDRLIFKKMTSTSPANTISFEKKMDQWKIIKEKPRE